MEIVLNTSQITHELPGMKHQTLADFSEGLENLEFWVQRLEPGAAPPALS
jgi:hypothetical protein